MTGRVAEFEVLGLWSLETTGGSGRASPPRRWPATSGPGFARRSVNSRVTGAAPKPW